MPQNSMRKAIAMIELIFALVIMGIVLMSAPSLLMQAKDSGIVTAQQEAIAAAASDIDMILSKYWDENDTNTSLNGPLLVVNNGDIDLDEAGSSGRRIGTPHSSNRSFITSIGTRLNASSIIGPDTNETNNGLYDDIDDYNGTTNTLSNQSITLQTTEEGNYADTSLQLTTVVRYLNDTPTSGAYSSSEVITFNTPFLRPSAPSTNIKDIQITVTSGEHANTLQTNITLHAFSCNIGTYTLKKRSF